MRVALVSTAFRTREPLDLDAHVRSLAPALARAGADVEVFTAVRGSGLAPYAQRRFEVHDHVDGAPFGVTTIEVGDAPDVDRIGASFGAFLDRERPAVCHLEALDLFGTNVVHEARTRGIATLHCARDTWPAHDLRSLTLPDLSPFVLGDGDAEARALVAEDLLGPFPEGGGLPDDRSERDRLRAILHEELTDRSLTSALREAREAVEVRRAEKRVALSAVDRRFAASRTLARQLSATVGRAFTYRAPGVDTSVIPEEKAATPAPKPSKKNRNAAPAAVRFGFIGTTRPIAGLQVLIDAFAGLRAAADAPPMDLLVVLERTDPERDARLRSRAEALGANVEFAAGSIDVTGALARIDVLIHPSLWGEFAPAGPRLALATGLPIVATRMPGLVETLPEDATALVAPSDAEALAEAIEDMARRGERYDDLRARARTYRHDATAEVDTGETADDAPAAGGPILTPSDDAADAGAEAAPLPIGPAKTIDDEAKEWLDTYEQLATARRVAETRTRGHRLVHVEGVADELAALRELSVAELFARAQEGIGRLRRAFGLSDTDASLLGRVVARGGLARDRSEQAAAAQAELERSLETLRAARDAMHAEEAGRVRRVGDLHAVLGQYEQEALARGAEAARIAQDLEASREERDAALERETKVAAERDELGADLEKQRERAAAAETQIKAAQVRFEEVAGEAETARNALEEAEAERTLLAKSVEEREEAIRALRDRVIEGESGEDDGHAVDLERIEAHCVALERDVSTLRRHDAWLGEQTARLVALFENAGEPGDGSVGAPTRDETLERSSRALDRLTSELVWRRGEMEAARRASETLRARLAGGALTSRVQSWTAGPPIETGEGPKDAGAEDAESKSDGAADAELDEPAAPLPRRAAETAAADAEAEADADDETDDASGDDAENEDATEPVEGGAREETDR